MAALSQFSLDLPDMNLPVAEPNLDDYDLFVVALSGGKDSVACLLHLLERGVDPERIELMHHDVDGGRTFMDWPITPDYCRVLARAFNLPIYVSWREGGFYREMHRDNVPTAPVLFETPDGLLTRGGDGNPNTRGKYPQVSADLKVRWCSPYLKIDVASIAINNQPRFNHKKTLFITGERAEESAGRAKYKTFENHRCDRRSSRRLRRLIDHWRPVHKWSTEDVWAIFRRFGVIPHPAYFLGWGRVSCMSCIFGSADQWATLRLIAPDRFEEIALVEERSGLTIRRNASVRELADRGTPYLDARGPMVRLALSTTFDVPIRVAPEQWLLPAGAFGESCGPI